MSAVLEEFLKDKAEFEKLGLQNDVSCSRLNGLASRAESLARAGLATHDDLYLKFEGGKYEHGLNVSSSRVFNVHFINCTFVNTVKTSGFGHLNFLDCSINDIELLSEVPVNIIGGDIFNIKTGPRGGGRAFIDGVEITNLSPTDGLRDVTFKNCTIEWVSPQKRHEHVWETINFISCTFKYGPNVLKCSFEKDVKFIRCIFLEKLQSSAVYFQDLKEKMIKAHDDASAHEFAAYELKCKSHELKWGMEKLLDLGYRAINDYGLDPYRPLKFIGGIGGVSTFLWIIMAVWTGEGFGSKPAMGFWSEVFYLTMVSILGPFRLLGNFNLIQLNTFASQVVMFVFTALSSLFWFFLILAIRRRFRVG